LLPLLLLLLLLLSPLLRYCCCCCCCRCCQMWVPLLLSPSCCWKLKLRLQQWEQ